MLDGAVPDTTADFAAYAEIVAHERPLDAQPDADVVERMARRIDRLLAQGESAAFALREQGREFVDARAEALLLRHNHGWDAVALYLTRPAIAVSTTHGEQQGHRRPGEEGLRALDPPIEALDARKWEALLILNAVYSSATPRGRGQGQRRQGGPLGRRDPQGGPAVGIHPKWHLRTDDGKPPAARFALESALTNPNRDLRTRLQALQFIAPADRPPLTTSCGPSPRTRSPAPRARPATSTSTPCARSRRPGSRSRGSPRSRTTGSRRRCRS
jgi:hypothetical protein